ncbi:hypothetical protein ACFFGH_14275 [Lysobacter korlensis]|uniref:DUF1232 domain-containing protein n=1 Tax=Lysobacter korlensis TaxID=553636 RepID=A0ABV6RPV2_9GAMM
MSATARPAAPTPLPDSRSARRPSEDFHLQLQPDALTAFDVLLHELNPRAVRADAERISNLARWLSTLRVAEAHTLLDRRLDRAGELGAMLVDSDWEPGDGVRQRATKLLDYVDRDDDLIDDRIPVLGLLDDALLVDLAWPAFASEVDDYLDFCAYRREHQLIGVDARHRSDWLRDRHAEIELWRRQVERAREHYARCWIPDSLFRIR